MTRYRLAVWPEGVDTPEFPTLPTVGQEVFDALSWRDPHTGRVRATWHGGVGHRRTTERVFGRGCGCGQDEWHGFRVLHGEDRAALEDLLGWCERNTRLGDGVELLPVEPENQGGAR